MELKIEPTGIADRLLVLVTPPQWGNRCMTIGAGHSGAPICFLLHVSGRLREGPVCVVIFMI